MTERIQILSEQKIEQILTLLAQLYADQYGIENPQITIQEKEKDK